MEETLVPMTNDKKQIMHSVELFLRGDPKKMKEQIESSVSIPEELKGTLIKSVSSTAVEYRLFFSRRLPWFRRNHYKFKVNLRTSIETHMELNGKLTLDNKVI